MGLENTFNKVEKLPEEKKLEVFASEDAMIDELLVYLESSKKEWKKDFTYFYMNLGRYFSKCMEFLKNYNLNSELISKVNDNIIEKSLMRTAEEKTSLGVFLSAMIQIAHNQGYNNFNFNRIDARYFGMFLHDYRKEKNSKIVIKAGSIRGEYCLESARNCFLYIESLRGDWNLNNAFDCLVEIKKYKGEGFGWGMRDCTIKSPRMSTLLKLRWQYERHYNQKFGEEENNRFELKK